MPTVVLAGEDDFDGWRRAARGLRLDGVRPETVTWTIGADLFGANSVEEQSDGAFTVPAAFVEAARDVFLHRSPARFGLLYALLWRLGETPDLLDLHSDPDVRQLSQMRKAVSLAAHKMKAFVRFQRIEATDVETYVAWFEPAHRVVERTAPFFARRFATMNFSILTPDACAHWDRHRLTFTAGETCSAAPASDALEDLWATYYASIFNPARLKVKAMQKEMPKRYWRNLPEAALIAELIAEAETRTRAMVQADAPVTRRRVRTQPVARTAPISPGESPTPPSLEILAGMVQACRRCDLWRDATQAVTGEGPASAALMLVGEQPGDREDLAGRPFVGPAGELLDHALAEAGVDRAQCYITNAVKHFKHEARGKRRLHKTPDRSEVQACRWWLDNERRLVRPRVIVALGATAAGAVFGRPMAIMKSRGQVLQLDDQAQGVVTVHPSYLLRVPDAAAKAEGLRMFIEDLKTAARCAGALGE